MKSLLLAAVLVLLPACGAGSPSPAEETMREIQSSHIEGNVPPPSEFDAKLAEALRSRLGAARVEVEMLRDGPTQSGTSYPKFYVWVRGWDDQDRLVEEGAARTAAIDRVRFEVTDYLSRAAILQDPERLDGTFPAPVAERVRRKVGLAR